jgi:hypothetical protein
VIATGTQLKLYFSRGQSPIPGSTLSQQPTAFETITVPPPAAQSATVSPTGANSLAVAPESRVTLADFALAWSTPAEPALLPITLVALTPAYHTGGLQQGAALWTNAAGSGSLVVTENGLAPPPLATDRSRERAAQLSGSVDAKATGVRVAVLNASGAAINLLQNGAATAPLAQVNAVLGVASGATASFTATLLFQDATAAFGPIQVLAQADGLTRPDGSARPVLEVAFFVGTGVKTALIDDGEPSPGVRGEANELVIVDFGVSPQATVALISAQTRARRMVRYQIRNRTRAIGSVDPTSTSTTPQSMPEMPQWMGELQFAGLTKAVSPHLSSPPSRRQQAVYQREIVRRYNGGSEFRFQGGDFEIFPTQTSAANIVYPNQVLGTGLAYAGVAASVAFTNADFGSGI